MYSVIIPTLWRSNRIKKLLQDLVLCKFVGEVIIIDNNSSERNINIDGYDKIKIIDTGKNEYVNPSWNLGVANAKCDFVALCNDDINFNPDIFEKLKIKDNELVGISTSCYEIAEDSDYKLEECTSRCFGFGCLMFFSKKSYKPIPNRFKIWYGDDYLMNYFQKKYQLNGLSIKTEMSSTSKSYEFYKLILQDEENYKRLTIGKNLVVITSVINPFDVSMYSPQQRLEQLIKNTIPSLKKKIPNCHIVIIEGSELTKEQTDVIKTSGANELLYVNVKNLPKSYGEVILLLNYFKSPYFQKLINENNINTINKISGRYYLTDEYDFLEHNMDDCIILKKDTNTWSGKGLCETRYYRFPLAYINHYVSKLEKISVSGISLDVEHSFYENEILPFDKIKKLDRINVQGNVAPNGTFVSD
jgi:hypothetical protein